MSNIEESVNELNDALNRAQTIKIDTVNEVSIESINTYIRELTEARDELVLDYIGNIVSDKYKDYECDEERR